MSNFKKIFISLIKHHKIYTLYDILYHMRNLPINLDVPIFRQTMLGSCGPACLLMVLKYHNPNLKINRILEFRAWIFAQLFPFGMTDAFGLAGFAVGRQFDAMVIKEKKEFDIYFKIDYLSWIANKIMIPFFRLNYERIRKNTLRMGVIEKYKKIDLDTILDYVKKKKPPIVMVDQTKYNSESNYSEGILHWVVVTGFSSNKIKINDPDIGPLIIPKEDFKKSIDLKNFRTDKRIVIINNRNNS